MNWFTKIKSMCGFGNYSKTAGSDEAKGSQDFSDMTVKELKSIAKERGIKGYYKFKKAELISVLDRSQ